MTQKQKLLRLLNLIAKAVVKPEGLHPHFHLTDTCLEQVEPPIELAKQRKSLLSRLNPLHFNTISNPPSFLGKIS
jgi:hypothetical protein